MVAGYMGASVQTYGHVQGVTGSVRLKSNYEGCWVKVPGNFGWMGVEGGSFNLYLVRSSLRPAQLFRTAGANASLKGTAFSRPVQMSHRWRL